MKSVVNQVRTKEMVLLLIGIIAVSINLRPAITAVGPLIGSIRADLGISNGIAGFLTTLPLLSFALLSFLAPKLGYRFGNERVVFVGMLTLMIGIIVRASDLTWLLFTGTALIGIGIAIGNVLLPSIVKSRYPTKVGLLTGLYTMSMSTFAAIGSGISVPLATNLHLGWKQSLLFWVTLAIVAVIVWFPQVRRRSEPRVQSKLGRGIWRSSVAWQVTIFMGSQSFLFYSLIAWLPELLTASGISISAAGWLLFIMQVVGLPLAFVTPIIADRVKNQKMLVAIIGVFYMSGLVGLVVGGNLTVILISMIFIGISQGASISLALTLIGLRTENSTEAAQLSGMSQSLGYLLAAVGPTLIGYILDLTQSATMPIFIFILIALMMTIAGIGAGRRVTIFNISSGKSRARHTG